MIDGAKMVGIGFLLIQYINDRKPEKRINIINVGLCLLQDDCEKVELISNCWGLLGLLDKYLTDVDNKNYRKS